MSLLYPVTQQVKSYFDKDGNPLNGTLRFGIANLDPETTSVTVFWDIAGTQPAAQPIQVRNGYAIRGSTPANVFATGDFSAIARDSRNRLIYTVANSVDIQLALSVIGAGTAAVISVADAGLFYSAPKNVEDILQQIGASLASVVLGGIPTGVSLEYSGTTAPTGFVIEGGGTIGNAASAATQRNNADTSALYTLLWNANTELVIQDSAGTPTTRGASAAADFAANKRLCLPDRRGRTGIGKDNMGVLGAANLITVAGGNFDGTVQFRVGGGQNHILTTAQTTAHTHTIAHTHDMTHTHSISHDHPGSIANPHTHTFRDGTVVNFGSSGVGSNRDDATLGTTSAANVQTVTIGGLSPSTSGAASVSNTGASSAANSGSQGSGAAHPNVQPSIVKTYIIKL